MFGAGAKAAEGGEVGGGAVGLVLGKAVGGVEAIELAAEAVARHLGDDRGTGNE